MTNAGAIFDNVIYTFLNALATYEGLKTSTALLEGVNQFDVLVKVFIAIIILNIIIWKSESIKYGALKDWLNGIYQPFNTFLMLLIVRVGDEFVFDDTETSFISVLSEPIVIISVLVALQIVIK